MTVVPSGSFTAIVAVVAKEMPFSVSVLVVLSQVETSEPVLAAFSRAIASAPPSAAVKSAVLSESLAHLPVSVMSPVTGAVKSYSVSPSNQPIKAYPSLLGSSGFIAAVPLRKICLA